MREHRDRRTNDTESVRSHSKGSMATHKNLESYLIITIGPAGSGKSTVITDVIRMLGEQKGYDILAFSLSFKKAIIDSYVERDPIFIRQSISATRTLIENADVGLYIPKLVSMEACLEHVINSSDPKAAHDLEECSKVYSKIYMKARHRFDAVMDRDVESWFSTGQNVVYETIGTNDFSWIFQLESFQEAQVRFNYRVYLVYPYADRSTIMARALNRFAISVDSYRTYINTHTNPAADDYESQRYEAMISYCQYLETTNTVSAPRLPSLISNKTSNVYDTIDRVQNNISRYVGPCVSGSCSIGDLKCSNWLSALVFYDNNRSGSMDTIHFSCGSSECNANRCVIARAFTAKYGQHLTLDFARVLTNIQSIECGN